MPAGDNAHLGPPHTLRIHLQMLDFPARTIQIQFAPANAGTKHLATLARKVDYLSRSDSYISAPETVTVRETYILVWFRCQWPTTGYAIGGEVPP